MCVDYLCSIGRESFKGNLFDFTKSYERARKSFLEHPYFQTFAVLFTTQVWNLAVIHTATDISLAANHAVI